MKLIKKILYIPRTIVNFFKETFNELKQVEWLSRNKTLRYTLLVIIFLVIGATFIILVDQLFLLIRSSIILA